MNNGKGTKIELEAVWGNDDAGSVITVSHRQWEKIQLGAEYSRKAWYWYEGKRTKALWVFQNKTVTIHDMEQEFETMSQEPLNRLFARIVEG